MRQKSGVGGTVYVAAAKRAESIRFFKHRIARWFTGNARHFAWRLTRDPYRLLVAEMMLRRTRAAQVEPVYVRFVACFPSPRALAAAPHDSVSEVLKPLGLTWRVPAFQQMAREVSERYGGTVPVERDGLLSLPGVGDYVADAVRCFANSDSVAIVDTNTVRVAARYLGFQFGPDSRRRRAVRSAVASLLDKKRARESNLALLDFAATICKAVRPQCDKCPVASRCVWRTTGFLRAQVPPL